MTKQCHTVNDSNKLFAKVKGEAETGQIVQASRDREGVKHTEFTTSASPSLRVYRHVEKSKICDLVSIKGPVRPDGSIYPFFFRNISVYFEPLPTTVAASCCC